MCMEHKDIESWGCDVGVFVMVFSWDLSLFVLETLLLEQSHTHSSRHSTSFFLK